MPSKPASVSASAIASVPESVIGSMLLSAMPPSPLVPPVVPEPAVDVPPELVPAVPAVPPDEAPPEVASAAPSTAEVSAPLSFEASVGDEESVSQLATTRGKASPSTILFEAIMIISSPLLRWTRRLCHHKGRLPSRSYNGCRGAGCRGAGCTWA